MPPNFTPNGFLKRTKNLPQAKISFELGPRADRSDYVAFEDNVVYNNTWWSSSASSGMIIISPVVSFHDVT